MNLILLKTNDIFIQTELTSKNILVFKNLLNVLIEEVSEMETFNKNVVDLLTQISQTQKEILIELTQINTSYERALANLKK